MTCSSRNVVLWNVKNVQKQVSVFQISSYLHNAILKTIPDYLEVITISELELNEILEHEITSSEVHTFSNLSLTQDKMYNKGNSKVTYIATGLTTGLCQER